MKSKPPSVSPSPPPVITNDFQGKIILSIAGLGSGKTVVVKKYADANGNGIAEAGELMVGSYRVTDGQVPLIGGVRNLNVPADEDGAANGQIRVELFSPGVAPELNLVAGNYLFRLSDPAAGFTPITVPLVVKQKSYPQGVAGRITAATTGLPLANASVLVLLQKGGPVAGAMTDANGNYIIYSPPGNYRLLPVLSGYVGDFNTSVAITANKFAMANVAVPGATRTISGKLKDSVSGAGIAGIFIQCQSDTHQFVMGYSYSAGNFSIAAAAGQWQLEPDAGFLAQAGYIGWNSDSDVGVNTSGGNVPNVSLPVTKSTALIYGTVKDAQNNPVLGIRVEANDQNRALNPSGRSFPTDGSYCLGVVAGNWQDIGAKGDDLVALGYLGQSTNVTVSSNQAVWADIVLRTITAHLSGRVVDEKNAGVDQIGVYAINGQGANANAQTDANGYFEFALFGGTWTLGIPSQDAGPRGLITSNLTVTVADGQTRSNLVIVARHASAHLRGRMVDETGAGVGGLGIGASEDSSHQNISTRTDSNGYFDLGVSAGTWHFYAFGDEIAARGLIAPESPAFTLADGQENNNINVVLRHRTAQINGSVKTSANEPIVNIGVGCSQNVNGMNYISYTQTDSNGNYQLDVFNGNWQVWVDSNGLQGRGYAPLSSMQTSVAGASRTVNFVVLVSTPLQVITANLPGATVGSQYIARLHAGGGQPPYVWNLVSDSTSLPAGFSLSSDGSISGLTWVAGTSSFIVGVSDPVNATANQNLTIVVTSVPGQWQWQDRAFMSMPRANPGIAVLNGKIYVAGGTTDPFNSLEMYDPEKDSWTALAPMPTPRFSAAAAAIGNELYVAGGDKAFGGGTGTEVEVYNPQTDSWSARPSMPTPRDLHAAAGNQGKLYLMGGTDKPTANDLLIFDPVGNTWSSGPSLPTLRSGLAAAAVGDRIIALGGSVGAGNWPRHLPTVEQYSPPGADRIQTIVFKSDATTLAAGLGSGAPSLAIFNRLDAGDTAGLTFQPDLVGASGAKLDAVAGAVPNTATIDIPPGNGQNGFFKTTFVLPESYTGGQLSLAVNADFYGRAFINGHAVTSSMWSNDTQRITQYGHTFVAVKDPAWLKPGTNELVIADANYDGGSSGVSFYGLVTYQPVPILKQPAKTLGQFQFRVGGITNETYAVEFSTNLTAWTTLFTTNATGSSFQFIDNRAADRRRFYRVSVQP